MDAVPAWEETDVKAQRPFLAPPAPSCARQLPHQVPHITRPPSISAPETHCHLLDLGTPRFAFFSTPIPPPNCSLEGWFPNRIVFHHLLLRTVQKMSVFPVQRPRALGFSLPRPWSTLAFVQLFTDQTFAHCVPSTCWINTNPSIKFYFKFEILRQS